MNEVTNKILLVDDDEGSLLLRDPETGEQITLGDVWNDSTDMSSYPRQIQLIAGSYDVYYSNINPGTSWPLNSNRKLAAITLTTGTNSYTIDVPAVSATVDVTLNGQPITGANTADDDEGSLLFIFFLTDEQQEPIIDQDLCRRIQQTIREELDEQAAA